MFGSLLQLDRPNCAAGIILKHYSINIYLEVRTHTFQYVSLGKLFIESELHPKSTELWKYSWWENVYVAYKLSAHFLINKDNFTWLEMLCESSQILWRLKKNFPRLNKNFSQSDDRSMFVC